MHFSDVDSFNVTHTLECGQVFRYQKISDGNGDFPLSYLLYKKDHVYLLQQPSKTEFYVNNIASLGESEDRGLLEDYFSLGYDYSLAKRVLSRTSVHLKHCIEVGNGIHILKQDPFETTISFIVSANNNIPRIKKILRLLSMRYGKRLTLHPDAHRYDVPIQAEEFYSFPSPESLAHANPDELLVYCNCGYRAAYIVKTAQTWIQNDYDSLTKNTPHLRDKILALSGVGPKVADCILLFAFEHMHSFPIDTWVKKAMAAHYPKAGTTDASIKAFANNKFKSRAGLAQQYLFYGEREGIK